MFLIILTVIGLSAANVGVLQERMAGNVRETNEAFQEAEATLREIEQALSSCIVGAAGCPLGAIPIWDEATSALGLERNACTLEGVGVTPDDWPWQTAPQTGNEYVVVALTNAGVGGGIFGSACRPMTELNDTALEEYFIVAARATGPQGLGEVVVQSVYFWPE
jgi:type IV pilus assembly protein PilX